MCSARSSRSPSTTGVSVDPCPPRHGNRKGVVEKAIDYLTQSWWRTARVASPAEAQASVDRFCVDVADQRTRLIDPPADPSGSHTATTGDIHSPDGTGVPAVERPQRVTVAELAAGETLLALPPVPYPA